jgi:hypothetical protein
VKIFLFLITFAVAQTPAPERDLHCSGPVSCGENAGQDTATFMGDLTEKVSGQPEVISESELKELETKMGLKPAEDILTFDRVYSEKNEGAEPSLPMTRAFQKYRYKNINVNDRGIDFVNTNENKSLGLSGPESKPPHAVDVELPAATKFSAKSEKKKKTGRPESN